MQTLDFKEINKTFYQWMSSFVSMQPGEWLSGDGKALGSTIQDALHCQKKQ